MAIVSDEQVIKVLRQYNPWWRNPLAIKEENKPQKRLAYYEALRMISHKTIRRFAVLSGARRVGKTTIMYQMMNSLIDGAAAIKLHKSVRPGRAELRPVQPMTPYRGQAGAHKSWSFP